MQIITLSNYAQQQLDAAAQQRASQHAVEALRYTRQVNERANALAAQKLNASLAWSQGQYLSWFGGLVAWGWAALTRPKPVPPYLAGASQAEQVWAAGNDGERRVLDQLSNCLSDEWTAIAGYSNPGGEVDVVLVGPLGVLAIEVKYLNGVIHCDGDRWWRDKYDKYGNVVEIQVPIVDKKGRGPSAQVNASADRLQRFLAERSPVKWVRRAVVLSHDASRIGKLSSITVDVIKRFDELDIKADFVGGYLNLDSSAVINVVRLIEKDHQFHRQRRENQSQRRSA